MIEVTETCDGGHYCSAEGQRKNSTGTRFSTVPQRDLVEMIKVEPLETTPKAKPPA